MRVDPMSEARRVVAKAWADEGFKARLLADPEAVLKAEGVAVPAGLKLVAHEDTAQTRHLVLPAKPDGEMADADLERVAGGFGDNFEYINVPLFSWIFAKDRGQDNY